MILSIDSIYDIWKKGKRNNGVNIPVIKYQDLEWNKIVIGSDVSFGNLCDMLKNNFDISII